MIDLAVKSGAATNVEFHQADCTKMPVADSTADRIFSLGLFDYLPDIDAALREFRRVVKPGGRIIVTIPKSPSLFAPMRWATGIRGKFFKVPPIVNALTRRQVDEAVTRHGLRIVDITSIWTTMWVIQVEANK